MPIGEKSFGEYVNKKRRDSVKQLKIIGRVLKKEGFKVESFLEDDDPYVYCYNPLRSSDFDGIRIYKIADKIAFRIQNESKTHPYGKAYSIDVEDIFDDFLQDDNVEDSEAGKKTINTIGKEVRKFFERTKKAEDENRHRDMRTRHDADLGGVNIRSSGLDYGSLIYNKI